MGPRLQSSLTQSSSPMMRIVVEDWAWKILRLQYSPTQTSRPIPQDWYVSLSLCLSLSVCACVLLVAHTPHAHTYACPCALLSLSLSLSVSLSVCLSVSLCLPLSFPLPLVIHTDRWSNVYEGGYCCRLASTHYCQRCIFSWRNICCRIKLSRIAFDALSLTYHSKCCKVAWWRHLRAAVYYCDDRPFNRHGQSCISPRRSDVPERSEFKRLALNH